MRKKEKKKKKKKKKNYYVLHVIDGKFGLIFFCSNLPPGIADMHLTLRLNGDHHRTRFSPLIEVNLEKGCLSWWFTMSTWESMHKALVTI